MRNETLSSYYNIQSEELYYSEELGQLYEEGLEYNFLLGKTPAIFPDIWQED